MERLSIIGDFFDCQLYDGRLYLWTFDGAVQVYDYRKIMDYWSRHQEDQESGWGDETGWAEIIITQDSLKRFLNYERDYFTSEFPVGTEVLDRQLYEANAAGLFKCQLPVCERRERAIQITDAPMISVKGAKKRGIVCAAGSDGLFWLPVDSDFGNIFHISDRQSIDASFCTSGIFVHSANRRPFLIPKINGRYSNDVIDGNRLYPERKGDLTWSWINELYAIGGNSLKVYHLSKHGYENVMIDEVESDEWNDKFINAETTVWGTVVESDDSIRFFADIKNVKSSGTLYGEVTRWRMYPRSSSYPSHIHIIFDERMDIIAMRDKI